MNAAALEADLRSLGVACTVEGRDGLALVLPHGDSAQLATAEGRREAVRLAEARGFTHIAIELPGGGTAVPHPDRPRS